MLVVAGNLINLGLPGGHYEAASLKEKREIFSDNLVFFSVFLFFLIDLFLLKEECYYLER